MEYILILTGLVIVICVLSGRLISRLAVPSLLFFILLGMLFGTDGLLKIQFNDYRTTETICSLSLIFIIFYGGFGTNLKQAKPVIAQSAVLSTLGVAAAAAAVGLFAHMVLGLPWIESLLIGSVISSTDAASVFNILRSKKLGLKYNTASMLELESGSNDPMSYMLTAACISMMMGDSVSIPLHLMLQLGAGLICGIIAGKTAVYIMNRTILSVDEGRTILTVATAILCFSVTEMLGGNGYLAVYLCGILLGNASFPDKRNIVHFFDVITSIAQMLIFFLLGLLVTPSRLPEVLVPAALIMVFLTLIARPLSVAILLLPFKAGIRQIGLVSWCGLRGAASIVFAIMAVLSNAATRYDMFNLVFCIVLLSISVQGTLLPVVSKSLSMIDRDTDIRKTFNDYEAESTISFVKTHVNEGHVFCGKYVRQLELPPEIIIVMILRNKDEKIIPNGNTLIEKGDLLIMAAPDFSDGDELMLHERNVQKGDKAVGKKLRDMRMEKDTLIVSVRRGEKTFIPDGNTVLEENDVLFVARFGA
ncbi:MAG: potassium/proton antiporter [Eubacteriales bacterium]|nr:potassium/proton antiporter [Eubacteriales bacterium]